VVVVVLVVVVEVEVEVVVGDALDWKLITSATSTSSPFFDTLIAILYTPSSHVEHSSSSQLEHGP